MTRIRRDRIAGRTLAELIFGIILVSAVLGLIGGVFLPGRWFYLGGILAGCVAACLLVINMYDTIDASLDMNEKRARSYGSRHAVLRILATGILLAIAIWIDVYAFVGAALGVASLKVSGLLHIPVARLFARFLPEEPEEPSGGIVYRTYPQQEEEHDSNGIHEMQTDDKGGQGQ